MKKLFSALFIVFTFSAFAPVFSPSDISISMTGSAGGPQNNRIKIWTGIIVPTVAMGQAIDYSSAGFSTVTNISILPQRSTSDPATVPNVALNGVPLTTGCAVNITQSNTATVVVLGINVLSGLPMVAATNLSSISLYIRVEGY